MWRDLGVSLLLAAAVLAVYGQSVRHEFVYYDDPGYVTLNRHVQDGLTWAGLRWAFTTTEQNNWHPLTWLSHMLDCQLFGLRPGGHHLASVLLHVANSVLLYVVLKRMTGAWGRSAMVAALFALHPLHVESVSWVAERKDVLSTLFWILMLGAYAWYAARPGFWRYLPVVVFLALGLMAKPMLVTAPLVLLLLDYWPLGRLRWGENAGQRVLEKAPLLVLVAASSVATYVAQLPAMKGLVDDRAAPRVLNALVAYVGYIHKMFWPSDLAVLYPYPAAIPAWQWAGAAALLAAGTGWALWAGRRHRYLAVGGLWFLGTLVPVIGLVRVGAHAMADRYTYVPYIGLFVVGVWGAADLVPTGRRRRILLAAAAAILAGCMVATWVQVGYWKDSATLLGHTLKVTTGNSITHNNLAAVLLDQKDLDGAIAHYREAVQINPDYADAYFNLGNAWVLKGRSAEAIPCYLEAIRVRSDDVEARANLARTLAKEGRKTEAIVQYREALHLKPGDAETHMDLARLLADTKEMQEAVAHYRESLRINPQNADAYYNLGNAWALQGRTGEAEACYRAALGIQPGHAMAHNNLAVLLSREGRTAEAVVHYREAVRRHPDGVEERVNLAWILATDPDPALRSGAEAVALAEQACALTGRKDARALDRLAAAYAEAGRFPEAVAAAEEARALAVSLGLTRWQEEIEKHLRLYTIRQPYRQASLPQETSP